MQLFSKTERSVNDEKLKGFIVDLFDITVKALVAILIIVTFIFRICNVVGSSMNNTLQNDERLIISNFFYSPKENDIIVFHQTGSFNEPIVKRVIATGDKWVKIDYDNALLYVSSDATFDEGDIIDESSYIYLTNDEYNLKGTFETYVPEGYLFVLGDNRNNSSDSRFDEIGLVDVRTVLGKVILRFYPTEKFEIIN